MDENKTSVLNQKPNRKIWIAAIVGLALGFLLCGIMVLSIMPRMMIVTEECQFGFDETIDKLQDQIKAQGWVVVGGKPSSMNESLAKQECEFGPRVS